MARVDLSKLGNSFAANTSHSLFSGSGNVFFSPWSLFDCLAMVHAGARQNTAKQLSSVLGFSNLGPNTADSETAIYSAFKTSIESLASVEDSKTDFATTNKIWLQEGFEILKQFDEILQGYFQSGLEKVNFVASPENSRLAINNWVEKVTNGKIKDLLPSGIITPLTRLVLTNAVYFKSSWMHSFDPHLTKEVEFHINENDTIQAPMMYIKLEKNSKGLRYCETPQYQVLGLPYTGQRLSMTIVLPRAVNGLETLIQQMKNDPMLITRWTSAEEETRSIKVHLPKFRVEFSSMLKELLVQMGANEMFDAERANFSGISSKEELSIAAIIQKAFINVDEEGTEAAAATAVVFSLRSCVMVPEEPIVFKADRPFLFFIADTDTNMVIFMGKVENPVN